MSSSSTSDSAETKGGLKLLYATRIEDLDVRLGKSKVRQRYAKKIATEGIQFDIESIDQFDPKLLQVMAEEMNVATIRAKLEDWMANLRSNLKRLSSACETQPARFRDWNGISGPCIVAGGSNPQTPLILKQLDLLHNARLPIVACDRAFSLMYRKRVPEYVVVLENNRDPNYEFLLGGPRKKMSKDITLLASFVTHPDILADWKGDVVFFRHEFPLEAVNFNEMMNFLFDPLPPLWHGGNVGSFSYMAAVFLLANPIALVGMDFSMETEHVDPVKGKQFITDPILVAYAKAFADAIKATIEGGVRTYNCTGGGLLRAPWIEEMSLKDFLIKYDG